MLIGFRFLLGNSVGTASFIAPLYIAKVSLPKVRCGIVSFNRLAVTSGILIACIVNFLRKDVAGNWRWMLGLAALPGAALAIGMLSVPHTPRWLVQQRREGEARDVLERLRETDPDADIDDELDTITEASKTEGSTGFVTWLSPKIRPLVTIGLGLALFQQFVGISNVVFTILAVLLLDRVGRRKLLLTGTVGTVLSLILLGIYFSSGTLQNQAGYLALVALLIYIASFAIGLGPVFWLMISEIYPAGIRSKAMSVSTLGNWAANFLVAATFLSLGHIITRQGTFFLYAAIAVGAFVFFLAKVPETKDRTLEQIQDDLSISDDQPSKESA